MILWLLIKTGLLKNSVKRKNFPLNLVMKVRLLSILHFSTVSIRVANSFGCDETKKPPKTLETIKVPLGYLNRLIVFRTAPNSPKRLLVKRKTIWVIACKYSLFSLLLAARDVSPSDEDQGETAVFAGFLSHLWRIWKQFQLRFDPAITVIETQLNGPFSYMPAKIPLLRFTAFCSYMTVILRPEKHSNEIHTFYDRKREVSFIAQT